MEYTTIYWSAFACTTFARTFPTSKAHSRYFPMFSHLSLKHHLSSFQKYRSFFTITINICISFSYKNYIHHSLVFHECIAINLNFYIFTIKIFFLQVLITLHKVFFSPINSLFEKNSYFENFYKKMCVYRTNSSDTDTIASFSN